jgi:hypothetical protein
MTFKNNFIVDIKCGSNDKIMRVRDGVVTLPFGTEYSVYIKNINSVKAVVSLSIDGVDALDGNSRVVMPNTSITINGFMKGMKSTNKFKFTKKTKRISKHRGDFIDDGIVRVEYWFEKPIVYNNNVTWYKSKYNDYDNVFYCNSLGNTNTSYCSDGITVNGSKINETFVYSDVGVLEDTSNVISIKLNGYDTKKDKKIKVPLYTTTKLICNICGTKSKSSSKYCRHCGNNIEDL